MAEEISEPKSRANSSDEELFAIKSQLKKIITDTLSVTESYSHFIWSVLQLNDLDSRIQLRVPKNIQLYTGLAEN